MERFPLSDVSASCDNSGESVFTDQLCVFRVDASEGNPFEPCDYSGNYRIRAADWQEGGVDWPETGVRLYAFLPIHPRRRGRCRKDGLARSVSMKLRAELTSAGELRYVIRVSARASDLPGVLLERDYILVEGESTEKGVAVFYKNEYNWNTILNQDTWPLISVWPAALDAKLQQYYIMRSSAADDLRVSGEAGTPEALANGVSAEMGDNRWVVKAPYVPDAVSFVRMARDEEGRLTEEGIDVGVVTPYTEQSGPSAGRALVSVVMGERYARAFYAWAGITQTAREVPVSKDKPLQVTKCQDSVNKQWEMSMFFISLGDDDEAGGVRAIFRRSMDKNRSKVRPILDGVIYQPGGMVDPYWGQYLVTDLKWNGAYSRPYYIAFMQQFCLHIMSYLYQTYRMNAIEWRYALPREMDAFNQKRMSDIWRKEILGFLNEVSANVITHSVTAPPSPGRRGSLFPTLSESVAVSRYFDSCQAMDINPAKGYLALNVSGDGMDAALWQQTRGVGPTKLKWHSVARVGERKIFTQWIERYINDLAAGINDPETAALLKTLNEGDFSKHSDTEAKEALVDRLLPTDSDNLHANYKTNLTTEENGWGSALCNKITQGVTLTLFSLGYQVGALMQTGEYAVPPGPGSFTVAFAGTGSRVLSWVECGDFILTNFFKAGVLAAGAVWPNVSVSIAVSRNPGGEVGMGLLASAPLGFPMGWETLDNRAVMQDPYYYADERPEEPFDENGAPAVVETGAATAFYQTFRRNFPGNFNIKDLSESSSQIELANVANRAIGAEAYAEDVFKVLLESIYDVLESQ